MTSVPLPAVPPSSGNPAPTLLLVDGNDRRTVSMQKLPFTIGRKPGNALVLPDPRVSREHATITQEDGAYWLTDLNSKHGTFVNGQRISRHQLVANDQLEFGSREGMHLIFGPEHPPTPTSEELLSHIGEMSNASDLEKLSLLLEAARKLNSTRVLEDVLLTLLDLTLRLTRAERAYVFLRERDGRLRLSAGRDAQGKPLADDGTISRSILNEAATSGCEFLVTDTSSSLDMAARNSIVAFDLRTVICLPLCPTQVMEHAATGTDPNIRREVRGVLYLDSHFASREMSGVSHEVLRALATEAASLVQNAHLVQAEEANRRYQQELAIAASIQQNLMQVNIPRVPFATINARSVPCREIGGDFFDVTHTANGLALIVADVSGKGISAALLASTLQGMIYSQLAADMPLADIASSVNAFLCQKRLEAKYATLVLALLRPGGDMELVNCGHVLPLLISEGQARWLEGSNMPVGLLPEATYEGTRFKIKPGDRLLLYSDGVTESADASDDFFGDERLKRAALAEAPIDEIFNAVAKFCAGTPVNDDCTVLEMRFTGAGASGTEAKESDSLKPPS